MRHDVIEDRYARLYELPRELARLGHHILGICLSYRSASSGKFFHEAKPGTLDWASSNIGRMLIPGFARYLRKTTGLLRQFNPQIIIGASDSLHIVLARCFSSRFKVPYAVDLYDNFESFGLTKAPFLKRSYRDAVREADAVFCVSDLLSERVRRVYRATGCITTIESTIGPDQFKPKDRIGARLRLGLPTGVQLVGTAGALDYSRGIDRLYQGFEIVSQNNPNVHLAIAGDAWRTSTIPTGNRIHYLGRLRHSQIPDFYAALDVGVICLQDTSFGRYSFPQKAYEMAAMRIPLVVANVGAMGRMFSGYPECLFPPNDSRELAERIRKQLVKPVVPRVLIPTWADQAVRMEKVLMGIGN